MLKTIPCWFSKSNNIIFNHLELIDAINEIKKVGVKISLDDFGSGYSSLSYLKRIPLNRIKIDRAFIHNIYNNPEDEAIVRAIINMAAGLHLQVLAEGVESQEQLKFLKHEECNEAQGFYFCKPLPAKELEQFLRSHSSWALDVGLRCKKRT